MRKDLHYSINVVVNVRPQFKEGERNRQAAKAEYGTDRLQRLSKGKRDGYRAFLNLFMHAFVQ